MLTHLFVSNYALIDKLSLDLSPGLTILTGETGAGKSILLGALRLVLGERADLKAVKNAEKKCVIEAHFDISKLELQDFFTANDLDYDDNSIFRREILPSGKSRAFVNDVPVTIKVLDKLSGALIDIHSQFQTADLLKDDFQFNWIDAVANQKDKVISYQQKLENYKDQKKQLHQLLSQKEKFEKEAEYDAFLFNELDEANLDNVSLESLEQEQYQLENAEEIVQSISEVILLLENDEFGVLKVLNEILLKSKVLQLEEDNNLLSRLEALNIETKDITNELNAKAESVVINPERLKEVQLELNQINLLLQKHHVQDVTELIEIRDQLDKKLLNSLDVETSINRLTELTQRLEKELKDLASQIHQQRLKVIPTIEKEILGSLTKLGMPDAKLKFDLIQQDTFNAFGMSEVNLKFSANRGMELRTIAKSVSGGERSRLMLAVKESVAKHKELPTLILDEIDTGVSGKIAGSVGEIMYEAANHLQIIAITHLPQVAAYGQQQLKVYKSTKNGVTHSSVEILSEEQRIQEIAQMLSGKQISEAAIQQAKELLNHR